MSKKEKHYCISPLKSCNAAINLIYGERSRGKTFQMLQMITEEFWEGQQRGEKVQAVYTRRRREDIKPILKQTLFNKIIDADDGNHVEQITGGVYKTVVYYRGAWYLANIDADTGLVQRHPVPLMFDIALSSWYHDKGGSFETVKHLWLEEFVAVQNEMYLPGEFGAFEQVVSTVLRTRENTYIWLTGNRIDFLCPYFENFGITDIQTQEPGTIRKYKLGRTKNIIAVERTNDGETFSDSKTESGYRFAFNTQDSQLITSGAWQTGIYPLLSRDAEIDADVCGRFLILFKDYRLYGDIVCSGDESYIFIHRDPDPLNPVSETEDLVYTRDFSCKQNFRRGFDRPLTTGERVISSLISQEKVFFDDNVTGFVYSSFIKDCRRV